MSIPCEIWKTLDKRFLLSSLGRVFDTHNSLFIRPSIHKSRANYYLRISLDNKKYMLHVLVAQNFVDGYCSESEEYVVDHKDGNTLNPAASNLEWVTKSHNIKKMWCAKKFIFNNTLYYGKVKKTPTKKRVHR